MTPPPVTHSADEIRELHRRLHEHCDKPATDPTYSDISRWQSFLEEMKPLYNAGDLAGRFEVADLNAVMIRRENERRNGINWGRFPSRILQEPELFREMVYEERAKKRRHRPRPQPKREALTIGDTTVEVERDPAADHDAEPLSNAFADFLKTGGQSS